MLKTRKRSKGSIDRAFAARIRTENQDQASFCSFTLREVSVLAELALGHLRYHLTDVPPQSNSPPDTVLGKDRVRARTPRRSRSTFGGGLSSGGGSENPRLGGPAATTYLARHCLARLGARIAETLAHFGSQAPVPLHRVSRETIRVVVFHCRTASARPAGLPPMLHL